MGCAQWEILTIIYPEDCYKNIIDHYQKAIIIVLHDNYKSEKKTSVCKFPKLLEHL